MTPDAAPYRLIRTGTPLETARRAAVLLHGRDQDESVMLEVIGRLGVEDVAYLLPVAAARTWYDGRYFDPVADNAAQLAPALGFLDGVLDTAGSGPGGEAGVVLGGFSQGACLAAELMARRPRRLAGLAILTGSLFGPPDAFAVDHGAAGLRTFASISVHDAWIALENARATAAAFSSAGAEVTLRETDEREHVVSDVAVTGLRSLLG